MVIIDTFKIHDLHFELALAIGESLTGDAVIKFGIGRVLVTEVFGNGFDFAESEMLVFFKMTGSDGSLISHRC